ncbi:MAG: hypothetical protein M5U27_13470 [Gaiella sp.]|nr:hypothetical protein [Gaiella sp.]
MQHTRASLGHQPHAVNPTSFFTRVKELAVTQRAGASYSLLATSSVISSA